jgi:hypothetical protein
MFRTLTLAALSLLLLTPGHAVQAQSAPDFMLVNATGYTIDEVYVSRPNANGWGKDIMGTNALEDGRNVKITFNTDACSWDIKVVYDDQDETVWSNVNLCKINKLTLYWDKKAGNTRAVPE